MKINNRLILPLLTTTFLLMAKFYLHEESQTWSGLFQYLSPANTILIIVGVVWTLLVGTGIAKREFLKNYYCHPSNFLKLENSGFPGYLG